MYLHKHILVGSPVQHLWSKKNREPLICHDNIVIHYTAGATALSSVRYLISENTPVSAHVLIARDGTIYQMVDFNTQAWHCGKSKLYGKTDLNARSIGIELENAGLLTKTEKYFKAWFGKRIHNDQVVELPHPGTGQRAWWQTYTQPQLNTLKQVCSLLLFHYKFRRIVGHNEISLSGKIDPGPAFPLKEFKNLIYA